MLEIAVVRNLFECVGKSVAEIEDLPQASLKRIRGIGDIKVSEFGNALIEIIQAYCRENNIASDIPIRPGPSKPNTKRVTFDLYKNGKTIDQIAAERGLVTGTIEGHLS